MPKSRVQWLKEGHDLPGLEKVLRNRANPALRVDAADALGSLGDLEAVEPLARAVLQDPDREVQKAARQALANLVGAETDTVLATYRHHLSVTGAWQPGASAGGKEEEYLLDAPVTRQEAGKGETYEEWEESGEETDQTPAEAEWDQKNLEGMIAVLSHETNPKIRLQAINALQNSSNMRAIETLSAIALYDENEEIRQAARTALETRFGEDAGAIIDSYRNRAEAEEDQDEEVESEDEGEDEEVEEAVNTYQVPADTPRSPSTLGDYRSPPVIQEDRAGWRLALVALLVLLIVGGLVFILLRR